jgi:hypothetical protein
MTIVKRDAIAHLVCDFAAAALARVLVCPGNPAAAMRLREALAPPATLGHGAHDAGFEAAVNRETSTRGVATADDET